MKLLPLLLIPFLFIGCKTYKKRSTQLDCIDGKIHITIWQGSVNNPEEDIKTDHNLVRLRTLYLDDNNQPIKCIGN